METKTGLNIVREGNVAIASFTSTCVSDVDQIAKSSTQVKDFIETHQPKRMVFDFSNVRFFSSQVLGLLLEARACLEPYHGEVAVTSLSPQLLRVFKITNLDRLFSFYPDRAAAVSQTAHDRN